MFGTMFGDVGHGSGLLIMAMLLFFKPKSFDKSIRSYRSLLLFLSIFSIYSGLIYNEFISIGMPIFKTCYFIQDNAFQRISDCHYPLGFDFSWQTAANKITFFNSFKMKISVVIGVIHMTIGILMKGRNALQYKKYIVFLFEFLPQIIFFISIFGYMVMCIVLKWITYYPDTSTAPSIIALFINFVQNVDTPLYANSEIQLKVQRYLALIAILCVPIMFFFKPILNHFVFTVKTHTPIRKQSSSVVKEEEKELLFQEEEDEDNSLEEYHHEELSFGESLVHQSIETIEFVLGTVSNTASYLRLWALSLAHSQLAEVFLDMSIRPYFQGEGEPIKQAIYIVLMFIGFFFVTSGVLMVMSLMECLLHALRLQWVEFQNKFYSGEGYKFKSLNFIEYTEEYFGFFDKKY